MDEISNKTLATLLVVAIVISLAGTFFAMRGVSTVTNFVSGAATSTSGQSQVYINQSLSITLRQALVDFGAGYRNLTNLGTPSAECNLTSSAPKPSCWTTAGSPYAPLDFRLENDGNVFATVTTNSSSGTDFFTGCDLSQSITAGDASLEFAGEQAAESGCTGTLQTANTTYNNAYQSLCTNLSPSDLTDEINISITLRVPAGPAGNCSKAVSFLAALGE
ncbi:TPA: hypothetical protein HA265_08535 [Candidatus Woesearchaeota archaeon]|nr:hypothetical protein [Candidatus Woesearchaeota archaeon]